MDHYVGFANWVTYVGNSGFKNCDNKVRRLSSWLLSIINPNPQSVLG